MVANLASSLSGAVKSSSVSAVPFAHSARYELEVKNVKLVREIYDTLWVDGLLNVQEFLADDVDWWFHGPRSTPFRDVKHFQMMPRLVGNALEKGNPFEPLNFTARADKVFVEGLEKAVSKRKGRVSWVHIWTVKDGKITGLREYINTAIHAAVLKPTLTAVPTAAASPGGSCSGTLVWESKLWRERDTSTPGLILTI